jgi:hypothetical protein
VIVAVAWQWIIHQQVASGRYPAGHPQEIFVWLFG